MTISNAFAAFPTWMNRTTTRVQVFTWKYANSMQADCPHFRLRPAYRTDTIVKFRRELAADLRRLRSLGKIKLPVYSEAKGHYEF